MLMSVLHRTVHSTIASTARCETLQALPARNNFALCFVHNYLLCVLADDNPTGTETCNSFSFLIFNVLINIIVRYKVCIWLAFLIFSLHILKMYFFFFS